MGYVIGILDFLRKTAVSHLFVVFGMSLSTIAALGGVGTWVNLTNGEKVACFVVGGVFLIFGLVGYALSTLDLRRTFKNYIREQFEQPLGEVSYTLEEQTITFMKKAEEGLNSYAGLLVQKVHMELQERAGALKEAEDKMVASVEDATRRIMPSFAQVFRRASELIEEAEREIWFVNFALNFGEVHQVNKLIEKEYKVLTGRELSDDVRSFYKSLGNKLGAVTEYQILTINDDQVIPGFLTLLSSRNSGYETLDIDKQAQAIIDAKNDFRSKRESRRKAPTLPNCDPYYGFYESDRLPLQLLIVGLPSPDKARRRTGCLVFMVGTGVVGTTKINKPAGFYTELEPLVDLFRDFAGALMKNAKKVDSYPN